MVGQLAAPVTAPKLNSITYNRFSITARWSGDASAGNCYLLALYENGIQYKTQQVVGSSGALLNLTLDSQKTYTVMVAQTDFSYGSVGPYSNEITVIQAIPTDIQVTYNGSDIHARWDWPDESLSIEGGLISLFKADGSQLLVSEKLIGNQGTLIPSPPLLDITDYFVTVAYSTPGSTGPGSDPIPIIQQTVCLYRLTYNGDSIVATTDHSLSNPNEIGLFLYVDGQPAYSATGAGNLVILSLYKPLQPWQHAHVQVAVIQDHTCGPLSQPIPVLTGSLCLQSVSYDGNAISASWSGSTPNFEYTGATMLLFQEDTLVTNNSVIGMQGTLTLAAALDPAKQYSLRVAPNLGPSRGINSDAIPVVSSSGTFTQTSYQDGVVKASWTTAGTAGLTGCMFALLDGNELIASVPAGMSGGALDHNLPPGTNYRVAVRQMAGISLGPPSYAPVLTTAALIDEVITENDKITVLIAGTAGAQAFLYKGDTLQAGPVVASGTPLKAEIPFGVVPYYDYKIRVQAVQGSTFGPISAPTHVISGVPNILTSTYNGDDVKLSWEPVLNEPVTGYEVYLLDLDHGTSNTAYTKDDFIIVQVPPEGRHALQVKAIGAAASGILSPAVNVIKEKMRISSLAYDGTHLHTSWTASTITEAVYQISIIDDNDFTMLFDVTGHEAVLPMSLNPSINYTVKVRVVADNATGSWGAGTPVISALPLITSTVADNTKVSVFIDDAPVKTKPGVTGCQAFLYQDNTLVSGPIAAAGTPLKADFPISPLAYQTYAARIQAVGAGGTGPMTESAPVISGIPFIRSLDYNGVSAILAWDPVSGENVTGYKVHLLDMEHSITTHYSTKYCFIEIPVSIMQKHTLQIQAVGTSCSGPLSSQVNVINETITVSTVSYDGTFLHAAWTASATPGAAYQVCVSNGNDFSVLFDVTGNQESLPVSLNPTSGYEVNVRVVSDGVTGPWGPATPVISALPLLTSTVADHTKVTLLIDDASFISKPGVTGCQAYLAIDDGVVWGPVMAAGTPLQAEFSVNVLPYHTYTAMVQAVGPAGTGPLTDGVPVLSAVPVIKSLDYDGTMVYAAWSPVSAPVTGYTLTLASDSGSSVTVSSELPYASVPLDVPTADGTYTVSVQAIHGIASGPKSDGKNPVRPGLYYSTETANAPALKPANSTLPVQPFETCCLLPELYQTPPAVLPSVGLFALKSLTGVGNMKYYLAFAPSNPVWEFDANPFRSSIATDYVNFLTALEGKLKEQDPQTIGVLLPGAVQDVMQAIAGCIPQTFMESLYYSHGFSATWRYVDLRPGMRLQVEYESWQYISAQAPTYSNGYSFNGTIQYDISRFMTASGEHSTVLNVFLSSLEGLAIPAPTGSGPGPIDGGGGGIDTLFTGFAQPFLRIFYPTSFKKPCEVGSTYPRDNVMILAAASWSTLNSITGKITQGLAIPAFGTDYALFYLRGRNTLTPLIKVSVNGYPTWIPVGTTLAQALSQHGFSTCAIPVVISGLKVLRNWNGAYGNDSAGLTTFVPRYKIPIRINWGPSVLYANGAGWLDLPLIHGDEIQIMGDHL